MYVHMEAEGGKHSDHQKHKNKNQSDGFILLETARTGRRQLGNNMDDKIIKGMHTQEEGIRCRNFRNYINN